MELGQIVDYIEEYNRIHDTSGKEPNGKHKEETRREATQADWNALLG